MSKQNQLNPGQSAISAGYRPPSGKQNESHFIDVEVAAQYEAEWANFKAQFDALAKTSKFDLCTIYAKMNALREYMLINFETFEIEMNEPFKQKLERIVKEASTLQIVQGMKPVPNDYVHEYPKIFGKKKFMNCVIMIARDHNGDVIKDL